MPTIQTAERSTNLTLPSRRRNLPLLAPNFLSLRSPIFNINVQTNLITDVRPALPQPIDTQTKIITNLLAAVPQPSKTVRRITADINTSFPAIQRILRIQLADSTWYNRLSVWKQFLLFAKDKDLNITDTNTALQFVEARSEQLSLSSLATYIQHLTSVANMLGLQWCHSNLFRQLQRTAKSHGESKGATPLPQLMYLNLLQVLPQVHNLLLQIMWKTASRIDEMRRLTYDMFNEVLVEHELFHVIHWGRRTKTSRTQPFSLRFISVIKLTNTAITTLRSLVQQQTCPFFQPNVVRYLQTQLNNRGMTAHSVKKGAAEKAANIIATHNLPATLLPWLLKHKDEDELAATTVRYLGPDARALLLLNRPLLTLVRNM